MPLHKAIFTEPGVVGAKYAMPRLGLCSQEVRSPLTGLTDETKALADDTLHFAGLMGYDRVYPVLFFDKIWHTASHTMAAHEMPAARHRHLPMSGS